MNGPTHALYAKATARLLLAHGFAPGADRFLHDGRAEFVDAATLPDRVNEVACAVPGQGLQTELLGHNLSSFEHFQVERRGYRWLADESLSVGAEVGAAIAAAAGMRIAIKDGGERPPLAGILRDTPMQLAVQAQPGFAVGTFHFPAAAAGASFYALAAQRWAGDQNAAGWRRCAGYALHFVQDALCPHHAWGVLLLGHQAWEDALEAAWQQTFAEVLAANLFEGTVAKAVADDLRYLAGVDSVAGLCEVNAAWSVARFGAAHDLAECPSNIALRVSIRAVAASVRACELMAA